MSIDTLRAWLLETQDEHLLDSWPANTITIFRYKLEVEWLEKDGKPDKSALLDKLENPEPNGFSYIHEIAVMGGWKAARDAIDHFLYHYNQSEYAEFKAHPEWLGYHRLVLKGMEEAQRFPAVTPKLLKKFREELKVFS